MLSKNNFQERLRKMEQKNEHFSIRKLTVGAASVLIGLTFLGFSGHTVHADTTDAYGDTFTTAPSKEPEKPTPEPVKYDNNQGFHFDLPDLPTKVTYNAPSDNGNENTTETQKPDSPTVEAPHFNNIPESTPKDVTYTTAPSKEPEPVNTEKVAPNPVQGITNPNPPQPGRVNSSGTSGDNITEHNETKTISRIVTVKNPLTGETSTLADQSVTYTRTASYNNDTKETTYSDWKVVAGSPDFAAVTVPKFEGYTPSQSSIPAKTIDPNETGWVNSSDPVNITYSKYDEQVEWGTADPAGIASQEIEVRMPDSEDSADYYYKSFDQRNVFGIKNDNGEYTWGVVTFDAQPIDSLLTGNDFTYSATGLRGEVLPKVPEGYRAKIVDVQTVGGDLWDTNDIEIRTRLLAELDKKVAENPYELPTYTTPTGVSTKNKPITAVFKIAFERTSTPLKQDTFQELDIYLPNERDPQYYKHFDTVTVTGEKDANGKESWNSYSYQAHSLSSLLAGNDFISANTASDNNSLPTMKGYTPKIVKAYLVNAPSDNPTLSGLLDELDAKIAANPSEIPAYTIPAGLSTPVRVGFDVVYEANSTSGTPLTQDDKPAFNGGVAGIPLTQDDKPAFNGGVAGIPLTQDDKPAFEGGVSGTPETQPDLPVAPLPEEPETPTDSNNNVPGQPVDTNEGTVAPHSTDNPDNGDNSVETPVVHATEAVKADNTDNGVTAPVHAAAAHNDEKQENTLPQTGAKATTTGVLGLMLASVGAIFGLAATKKRKN